MTDRSEVWYSTRGTHVPPAGHGFLIEPRTAEDAPVRKGSYWADDEAPRVHLVNLHHPRGTSQRDRDAPGLTTRCDMVLHPEDEVAVRAIGELCTRCADAAGLTEGLEWHPTG